MTLKKSRYQRSLTSIGMAFGIAGILLILFYAFPSSSGAWIHLIENKILDSEFRNIKRPLQPDPSIAIVVVNDTALTEMEPQYGRWPWPRRSMGQMVEYLHHVGARAIAIDILYPEAHHLDAAGDQFFVDQVKAAGNVILAADFPERNPSAEPRLIDSHSLTRFQLNSLPNTPLQLPITTTPLIPFPQLLAATAQIGGIHFNADPDGPTRRYRLLYSVNNGTQDLCLPSLALATALQLKVPIDWHPLLEPDGSYLMNWYGPHGTFPYIEASRLLQAYQEWKQGASGSLDQEAAAFFKDKIVLIGVTATGLFDLRATPFSPIYPGVEIHATVLSNLMQHHFIRIIPPAVGILYVLCITIIMSLVGRSLRSPIKETLFVLFLVGLIITCGRLSFGHNVWIPIALPLLTLFFMATSTIFWNYFTTGREKRFIRGAFARYINADVLDELLSDPEKLELGGENAILTVLFSDIRGFTSLSEKLAPNEVVALLNEYLTAMVDIVFEYHGTLDKFIGDAVMAFWGAPIKTADHAASAVQAGLAMLTKAEELRTKWLAEGKPALEIGIGINTAEITVGNIGSSRSQSYTVIGDGVNLASRLESLNKTYHTHLIISEFTYAQVRDQVEARLLDDVQVKGKEQSVKIYEVTGWRG